MAHTQHTNYADWISAVQWLAVYNSAAQSTTYKLNAVLLSVNYNWWLDSTKVIKHTVQNDLCTVHMQKTLVILHKVHTHFFGLFNRPSVVGAVLQPPLGFIDWLSHWSLGKISSKHLHSQTVRDRVMKFWHNVHKPMFVTWHKSYVTCHISHVFCQVSLVSCVLSGVTCYL